MCERRDGQTDGVITIAPENSSLKPKANIREKSRECHNHKPQPFADTKRKRKQAKPNKRTSNKRTKKH